MNHDVNNCKNCFRNGPKFCSVGEQEEKEICKENEKNWHNSELLQQLKPKEYHITIPLWVKIADIVINLLVVLSLLVALTYVFFRFLY